MRGSVVSCFGGRFCPEGSGKREFQRYFIINAKRQHTGSVKARLTFVKDDSGLGHDYPP